MIALLIGLLPMAGCASPPDGSADPARSTQQAAPLPECPDRYSGTSTPDCYRAFGPYLFTKHVTGTQVSVIVARAGTTDRTITATIDGDGGSGALLLRELTTRGVPDVLISTTGSGAHGVNARWTVWRIDDRGSATLGEVFGHEFWDAGAGFVSQYAAGGGWAVTFAHLDGGRLHTAVSVGRRDTAGHRDAAGAECAVISSAAGVPQPADPCGLALTQAHAHGLAT